jgi:exonuclease III
MLSKVSKSIRVIVVYRPPPSTLNGLTCEMFLTEFRDFTEQIILDGGDLVVTGDFNFHVDNSNDVRAVTFLHNEFLCCS